MCRKRPFSGICLQVPTVGLARSWGIGISMSKLTAKIAARSAFAVALLLPLTAPVYAQTGGASGTNGTGATATDTTDHTNYWGLLGLLGLAGLAGLRRRPYESADTSRAVR